MRKIILLIAVCLFAFMPNIMFGAEVRFDIMKCEINTDSVKALSVDKVKLILVKLGYLEQGEYIGKESGIGASYGFYLKFLDLNREKNGIKNSYDFENYKVSWESLPLSKFPYRVKVVITSDRSSYVVNFKDE